MTSREADRLNRIADANRRTDEVIEVLERIEARMRETLAAVDATVAAGREEAATLRARLATVERELERWRHGVTVEGDFVCPDSLRMTALEAALRQLTDDLKQDAWWTDHPFTVRARAALAGDAPGETYTVGGADGITRTFKRDAPRCERCHGTGYAYFATSMGLGEWVAAVKPNCPSCSGTGLAPPGTGGGR
jgi:hypothetical protein